MTPRKPNSKGEMKSGKISRTVRDQKEEGGNYRLSPGRLQINETKQNEQYSQWNKESRTATIHCIKCLFFKDKMTRHKWERVTQTQGKSQ